MGVFSRKGKEEKNQTGISEQNKTVSDNNWKETVSHPVDTQEVLEKRSEKTRREEQIKMLPTLLHRYGLEKGDILDRIQSYYEECALEEVDMKSALALNRTLQYERESGKEGLSEFVNGEEGANLLCLMDKIVEQARKEAEAFQSTDPSQFINGGYENLTEMVAQIEAEKEQESQEEKAAK